MSVPAGALYSTPAPPPPRRIRRPRLRFLPWTARDLVLRHRRLLGALGILSGGLAAGLALDDVSTLVELVLVPLAVVLFLEGCVLAFPQPTNRGEV